MSWAALTTPAVSPDSPVWRRSSLSCCAVRRASSRCARNAAQARRGSPVARGADVAFVDGAALRLARGDGAGVEDRRAVGAAVAAPRDASAIDDDPPGPD